MTEREQRSWAAFVSRNVSTITLLGLREHAAQTPGGWLGLLGPRPVRAPSEGRRREADWIALARELAKPSDPATEFRGLWLGSFLAFGGAARPPAHPPSLPLAAIDAGFAPDLHWQAAPLDRALSLSDQLESLVLAARSRLPTTRVHAPLSVATSYSQRFLVELVARNRGESVDSVLREGVSLLCEEWLVDEEGQSR